MKHWDTEPLLLYFFKLLLSWPQGTLIPMPPSLRKLRVSGFSFLTGLGTRLGKVDCEETNPCRTSTWKRGRGLPLRPARQVVFRVLVPGILSTRGWNALKIRPFWPGKKSSRGLPSTIRRIIHPSSFRHFKKKNLKIYTYCSVLNKCFLNVA